MLPDIHYDAGPDKWTDIYALTGFPVGSALIIVNKLSQYDALVWLGLDPPTNVGDGFPCCYGKPFMVWAGAPGCWVNTLQVSRGRMSVQLLGPT